MSDFEQSVETPEVAEPETSEETPEVAEPEQTTTENAETTTEESVKTPQDTAFAEMRRNMQEAQRKADEAERKLAEKESQAEARARAFQKITGNENADLLAIAEASGQSLEEVMADIETEEEAARITLENEMLKNQIEEIKSERQVDSDVEELKKIDPNTTLKDLGEGFIDLRLAGVSVEDAYWAVKSKESANRLTPPKPIGKVNNEPAEKDFFTREEVDAMSEEEQAKNADKILKSTSSWR